MIENSHLLQILIFLGSSVILVPLFRKLGLGTVLGYLAAGSLIGPQVLSWVTDVKSIQTLSEFGVVFLLFLIGLELQPKKIWSLRKTLIGFGGLQISLTTLVFAVIGNLLGLSWTVSFVVGFALSLSSTAFALQTLQERKVLNTGYGRSSFAILLMQDVLAIPALALLPRLGASGTVNTSPQWLAALGVVAVLIFAGRLLMPIVLRQISTLRSRELFTGVTLFIVMGVAYVMSLVGLSMALGSFLAGVLLSESEYRHELEADLEPFKGLLMGLFFISVGMSVNLALIWREPLLIIGFTLFYIILKGITIYGVGRIMKLSDRSSESLSAYLVQGGEFAFVIFGIAETSSLFSGPLTERLTLIVTLSMILSPFVILCNDRFQEFMERKLPPKEFDHIDDNENAVVIAGFGRVGQVFGRLLRSQGIGFTAIDHDSNQIELLRRFEHKVYYGDASRQEILQAAGVAQAKFFIIAVDDAETSVEIAKILRETYPQVVVFARARNRQHVFELMEQGVKHIRRETLESSLLLTQELLVALGMPDQRSHAIIDRFRKHDELMLIEQYKVRNDQQSFMNISRLGMEQLAQVLREDADHTYIDPNDLQTAAKESKDVQP